MIQGLKPKAVLFDLYGTLLDILTDEHRPEVWDKLARFLRYQGLPADAEIIRNMYFTIAQKNYDESSEEHPEVDVLNIFRNVLLNFGYNRQDHLPAESSQLFRALSILRFELFPDTLPTLQALYGQFKLGLVTDAQRAFLDPELEMTGLASLMDVIIISSDHGFRKPDKRMFFMALDQLGVSPEEVIYVGDNVWRDICGARNANIPTILLNRNNEPKSNDCHYYPDKVFRNLYELREWLLYLGL